MCIYMYIYICKAVERFEKEISMTMEVVWRRARNALKALKEAGVGWAAEDEEAEVEEKMP